MERTLDVLELLSSESFHSGESLANTLGITRAAVWRHTTRLKEVGVEIESVSGKGYKLGVDFEPLDSVVIEKELVKFGCNGYGSIDVAKVVDSTNKELLRGRSEKTPRALFAEYQLVGKGRRGDKWISPPGAGVCFSVSRWFEQPQAGFSSLGLVVGLAVVKALKTLGIEGLRLKWPNDVVFSGAKLAGILIELRSEVSGPSFVVVGIGINTQLGATARAKIDRRVVDLKDVTGKTFSRNILASALLSSLERDLNTFGERGFEPFLPSWGSHDSLAGRTIQIEMGSRTVVGKAEGVDGMGALRVRHEKKVEKFFSGHITEL